MILYVQPSFAQEDGNPWIPPLIGKDIVKWMLVGDKGVAEAKDGKILVHTGAETKEHTFVPTKEVF